MRDIGVRELKAQLSETLRAVSRGEHVRVTRHGEVIAEIVPAGSAQRDEDLRRLVVEGRVSPATASRPSNRPRRVRARVNVSDIVLEGRESDR